MKYGQRWTMWQVAIGALCTGIIWSGGIVSASNTAAKLPPKGKITPVMKQMIRVPASRVREFPFGQSNEVERVKIPDFLIMKSEVSGALWSEVYHWATSKGYTFQNTGENAGTGKPITRISWNDAVVWANAYSEKRGLAPVYQSKNGVLKKAADAKDIFANKSANGYRLPTHKQWELAARWIGKTKPKNGTLGSEAILRSGHYWTPAGYASGAIVSIHDDIPSYKETSKVASFVRLQDLVQKQVGSRVQNSDISVCTKKSNALKICDMSGNALEWGWADKGGKPIFGGREAHDLSSLGVESVAFTGSCYNTHAAYKGIGFRLVQDKQ